MNTYNEVKRVLWYTMALNLFVALAKVLYGYITSTISMLADGFHSLFDGTSNVIGLIGLWIASHPPDESHPYGHKKYESFASLGIALLLISACYHLLKSSYLRLKSPNHPEVTVFSFVIIFITMLINIGVMLWERQKGLKLKSDILIADAAHTMSDLLASAAVVISLIAISMGYPVIDPIAAIIIALMIGKVGYAVIKQSSAVLTDTSRVEVERIKNLVMGLEGVKGCHHIRTRGMQDHIYVDLHIHVDPDMDTDNAHNIAHMVEDRIKKAIKEVTEVIVHIEPHR